MDVTCARCGDTVPAKDSKYLGKGVTVCNTCFATPKSQVKRAS